MRPVVLFWITALAAVGCEFGCALVLLNARPHPPLGFRLWFGGLALAAPAYVSWMYRRAIGRGRRSRRGHGEERR